jgi:hypothetical protein
VSPATLQVVGVLAGGVTITIVSVYLVAAASCLAATPVQNALVAELDAAPDGTFKDQVQVQAEGVA